MVKVPERPISAGAAPSRYCVKYVAELCGSRKSASIAAAFRDSAEEIFANEDCNLFCILRSLDIYE